MLKEMQERGMDARLRLHLLELELVAPCNDRTPDKLVGGYDDGDHREQAPRNGLAVSLTRGGLQIGTPSGQAEVAISKHKHLAGHEEEPSARDGDHGVPYQPDGGVGKLKFKE